VSNNLAPDAITQFGPWRGGVVKKVLHRACPVLRAAMLHTVLIKNIETTFHATISLQNYFETSVHLVLATFHINLTPSQGATHAR
jgi:hypothetical protein